MVMEEKFSIKLTTDPEDFEVCATDDVRNRSRGLHWT